VTDHLVTVTDLSAGIINLDLIIDVHYRDLTTFPFYPPETDTGAAVAQMMLNYLMWNSTLYPAPPLTYPSQQTLFSLFNTQGGAYLSGDEMWNGLNTAIDDYHHGWIYGYFFNPCSNISANEVLKQMCVWFDYPVNYYNNYREVAVPKLGHPNHVPIAVPLYGDYNNWAVVRGIHTNQNVWPPDHAQNLEVYGFWVNGFLPGGTGENTYVTAQRFLNAYFLPLNVPGDTYNGKFFAVIDPARDVPQSQLSTMKVTIAQSDSRLSIRALAFVHSVETGKAPLSVKDVAYKAIVTAAMQQIQDVLKYGDQKLAESFADSHLVKTPQYSKSEGTWKIQLSSTDTTFHVVLDSNCVLLQFSTQGNAGTT
jgi:hypothetical protein